MFSSQSDQNQIPYIMTEISPAIFTIDDIIRFYKDVAKGCRDKSSRINGLYVAIQKDYLRYIKTILREPTAPQELFLETKGLLYHRLTLLKIENAEVDTVFLDTIIADMLHNSQQLLSLFNNFTSINQFLTTLETISTLDKIFTLPPSNTSAPLDENNTQPNYSVAGQIQRGNYATALTALNQIINENRDNLKRAARGNLDTNEINKTLATTYNSKAIIHYEKAEYMSALKFSQAAVDHMTKIAAPALTDIDAINLNFYRIDNLALINDYAMNHYDKHLHQKAFKWMTSCIKLTEELDLNKNNPILQKIRRNYAIIALKYSETLKANNLHRENIEILNQAIACLIKMTPDNCFQNDTLNLVGLRRELALVVSTYGISLLRENQLILALENFNLFLMTYIQLPDHLNVEEANRIEMVKQAVSIAIEQSVQQCIIQNKWDDFRIHTARLLVDNTAPFIKEAFKRAIVQITIQESIQLCSSPTFYPTIREIDLLNQAIAHLQSATGHTIFANQDTELAISMKAVHTKYSNTLNTLLNQLLENYDKYYLSGLTMFAPGTTHLPINEVFKLKIALISLRRMRTNDNLKNSYIIVNRIIAEFPDNSFIEPMKNIMQVVNSLIYLNNDLPQVNQNQDNDLQDTIPVEPVQSIRYPN